MRLGAAVVVGALAWATPAWAHKGKVTRTLMLEATAEHRLVVVVHLKITGDDQRRALMVLADADRDNRLSRPEEARLEAELTERALGGLRLTVDTATVTLADAQAKLQFPADGPVELMVHGTAPLPSDAERITVRTGVSEDPAQLIWMPGARRGRVVRGTRALVGHPDIPLGRGDRVSVELQP
ncbi:MAG: hypothetical protein H6730_36705 [Deltaproteobacteria bacterium]|nr:hypothetical protein [Deltaproteobacteria bacterium]